VVQLALFRGSYFAILSGVGRISRLLIDVSRGRRQWYFPSEGGDNKVLRKLFESKWEKESGDWRRLHYVDLHICAPR
jgi:hypothetical protein